jgi:hypothetical protein
MERGEVSTAGFLDDGWRAATSSMVIFRDEPVREANDSRLTDCSTHACGGESAQRM